MGLLRASMFNKTSAEEDTEETAKYFINDRHIGFSHRKIWSTASKTSVRSNKMGSEKGHWTLCSKV